MKNIGNNVFVVNTKEGVTAMTPLQIYDRVIADSEKSNYNWLFSASELVRITSLWGFPSHYAKEIQMKVLNCFASLAHNVEHRLSDADLDAVSVIYNKFILWEGEEEDKDKIACRDNYLRAVIDRASLVTFEVPIYYGPQYKELVARWKKAKFEMYQGIYGVDFRPLLDVLVKDFKEFIMVADQNGFMDADKEYQKEAAEKHIKQFVKMLRINIE